MILDTQMAECNEETRILLYMVKEKTWKMMLALSIFLLDLQ